MDIACEKGVTKDLRSAQQGVHLLQEPGTVRVLLAHLDPQNTLSGSGVSSNKNKFYCVKITVLFLEIIGLSPKSSFSQLMLQI
jgi:hypothetical protein